MCDHNGSRLRRDENHFLYHFTSPEPHTAGQASAMEEPGLPTAADELKCRQPPDKDGMEACALATEPDCLTGEPLDERELWIRIIWILYHGKGCAAFIRFSRMSTPDPGTLAERRSRETTSAEG